MRRLLIRPGAIGDLIVSLPALEFLRAAHTEVWTARQNTSLVRFADRVQAIPATGLDMLGLSDPGPRLIQELRSFDEIHSWYGSTRVEFRDVVRDLKLPFHFYTALPRGSEHAVDFYLEQVGAPTGATPRIAVPKRECDSRIVIHPFASSRAKRWPLDRFRELGRLANGPVFWLAGPDEQLDNAVRIADLYELACWLSGARLYVGNDSGISHMAAAVGVPTAVFFGPTDPAVWAPRSARTIVLPMDISADEAWRRIGDDAG